MMATSSRAWGWQLGLVGLLAMGEAIAISRDCALAQIAPDTTLGSESSRVTSTGSIDQIDGGATRGANLFHSFEQFSVITGREAHFNNALDIQNIISRVTGKSISSIDGLLRANGTANLFLLNPNGIIFGPNASLNIGGSFLSSTASSLNFADGTQFSATAPQTTPLLTISVPIGLQYGEGMGSPLGNSGSPLGIRGKGETAGSIRNQSQATNSSGEAVGLEVQPGATLALLGGDVQLDGGNLQAPGGRVELGGLAGAGTVGLNVDSNNLGLSFPVEEQRADVSLTNGADVNVSAGGGGSIAINAHNLSIAGGSSLRAGINSGLGSPSSVAGDIGINATGSTNLNDSSIANSLLPEAVGKGGGINITTGSLAVTDGAELNASTLGQGNAGGINITTGSLFVRNGALLQSLTDGQGDAGSVNINARDTVSLDGIGKDGYQSAVFSTVEEEAIGNGGGINITTGSLAMTNGAQLEASTFGQGNAGSVTIHAGSTVSLDGVGRDGYPSAALSRVDEGAEGNGGGINITTGSLAVTNGAQLEASTSGKGNAGSVTIHAGGTVSFDETGKYGYRSAALSTVDEGAVGKGGGINITTGSLSVTDGAELNASTLAQGNAGNIQVNAADSVSLSGFSSTGISSGFLTSTQEGASGQGGEITVNTASFSIASGAVVNAQTLNSRDGGRVTINTNTFEAVNGGQILTTTRSSGRAGSISLNATDSVTLSGNDPTFLARLEQFDSEIVGTDGGK